MSDDSIDIVHPNSHWKSLVAGLQDGDHRHGISDGRWSLIDLLTGVAEVVGHEATLHLAVWTASGDHGKQLRDLINSRRLRSIRLMVDRSFVSRQPGACEKIVEMFGSQNLRVWSAHAKFALFTGGAFDVMCQFSANLNRNKRLENFSVIADKRMVEVYLDLIERLWESQGAGVGVTDLKEGRRVTKELLGPAQPDPEESIGSVREKLEPDEGETLRLVDMIDNVKPIVIE